MDEQSRQLRPILDYPEWPYQKWNRARQLATELDMRIRSWAVTLPGSLEPRLSEDRRTVTFCARVPHQPPAFEWSLLLADALHNYRTALDSLTWAMAHLDGAVPAADSVRKIYFPICLTRSQWVKQARGPLASVPEFVLERLHCVQPYPVEPVDEGVFVHLHELDIADKHKGLVQASVVVRRSNEVVFDLKLEGGVPWEENVNGDAWEWISTDGPVRDGDPVFRMRTVVPMDSAESPSALPIVIAVTNRGKLLDVMDLLSKIDEQVSATFELVETGRIGRSPGMRPTPVEFDGPMVDPSENPSNHAPPR